MIFTLNDRVQRFRTTIASLLLISCEMTLLTVGYFSNNIKRISFDNSPKPEKSIEEIDKLNISLNPSTNENFIFIEKDEVEEFEAIEEIVPEVQPVIEEVEVVPEPEPVVEEVIPETTEIEQSSLTFTDEEIDLISIVTMAEAEGESELGKRLVIDVILNRIDSESFPNTVYDVIYQKGQFTSMTNGRSDVCYVKDDIRALVLEEIESRTNSEVLYFRTSHYHSFGTPVLQEGNHYFSK